jgi:hypothetical protein
MNFIELINKAANEATIAIITIYPGDIQELDVAQSDIEFYYLTNSDNTGHAIILNDYVAYNLNTNSLYKALKNEQYGFGNFGVEPMILLKIEHT